jgi:2EXR family
MTLESLTTTFHADFHYFFDLPAELRIMIWEYAQTPRLLHLKYMQTRGVLTLHAKNDIPFIPSLLHVCQESREIAHKWYSILVLNPTEAIESRVYVDFTRDVVYFNCRFNRHLGYERPWGGPFSHIPFRDWDKDRGTNVHLVRFVAFDCRFYDGLTGCTRVPRGLIKWFTNLRELMFVPVTQPHVGRDWGSAVDCFGFESIPVSEMSADDPLLMKLHRWIPYFKWDLLERRKYDPPGDWLQEDLADPNYVGSEPNLVNPGDFYPAYGYIDDPYLKDNNNEIFRHTKMCVMRDWNTFKPNEKCVDREHMYQRQFALEQIKPNNLTITIEEAQAVQPELQQLRALHLQREEDLVESNPLSVRLAAEDRDSSD